METRSYSPSRLSCVLLVSILSIVFLTNAPTVSADDTAVLAVIQTKCVRCHGDKKHEAGLNLASLSKMQRGSESGSIFNATNADQGRLYELIKTGEMPPKGEPQLTADERQSLLKWITDNNARLAKNTDARLGQVLPMLQLRCTACHGTRRQEGGLDLRTRESILKGGKSGPAVVAGDPQNSRILKRIHAGEMPPRRRLVEVSVKPMADNEIELLTRWIKQGTKNDVQKTKTDVSKVSKKDKDFWAYQTPRSLRPPEVDRRDQVTNAIDRFILSKLEARQLSLAGRASRRTLIRRLYLNLIGLPPAPDEIAQFINDNSPDAWGQLVDRVLASPRYGERWGGFWLDLCGYSDSEGIQHADPIRPEAWRYRDYVIRAFNDDKHYNQFLLQQLAGDELADYANAPKITSEIYDNLVATGFLRMSEDATFAGITSFVPDRLEVVDDIVEVLTSSVMGMTIRCARCHDHKFDPIPQADYYRLASVFKGALDENDWLKPTRQRGAPGTNDRYLKFVTTAERSAWQQNEDRVSEAIATLNQERSKLTATHSRRVIVERLKSVEKSVAQQILIAFDTQEADRTDAQKQLLKKHAKSVTVSREELLKLKEFQDADKKLEERIKQANTQRVREPLIRALWDRGEPSPTYILNRGNYLTPSVKIEPAFPSAVSDGTPTIERPWKNTKSTGRRLAFAKWLTRKDHPLTARVMVNRIWKHHFENGIVVSLDNFGIAGAKPSHPELLDWLAVEFVERDWSIKSLHRLILNSSTYRQSSKVSADARRLDPENQLLSRMPLNRMDAETIRDSMLAVAGRLRNFPFGAADAVSKRADGLVTSISVRNTWRRSIFVIKRRTERLTILANFDRPRMSPNCVERSVSTVAPQALHLLNNGMVHELAKSMATRVSQSVSEPARQIDLICELTTAKRPSVEEADVLLKTYDQLLTRWKELGENPSEADGRHRALTNVCHAMLNSAGFLYID
jgi:mono/diheme cytochrome c family protein